MTWVVGVDLGQVRDYTAIAAIECAPDALRVRHLERPTLGTSYPEIVARVGEVLRKPALAGATLVVDATGVGRAVVDMLEEAKLRPVRATIMSGNAATRGPDGWHVPKRDLAGVVQASLQSGLLKVAPKLALAEVLARELRAFSVKVKPDGHESYEALREGDHDDLVLAVALGCWYAERYRLRGGASVERISEADRMRKARFAEVKRQNEQRRLPWQGGGR